MHAPCAQLLCARAHSQRTVGVLQGAGGGGGWCTGTGKDLAARVLHGAHGAGQVSTRTVASPAPLPRAPQARLGQDSSCYKPDHADGTGGPGCASTSGRDSTARIRFEIVEYVEEADLEAMELLLRTLYGAQVESDDAELLLRALHRADFYDANVPHLASRLTQVPGEAITADAVQLAISERHGFFPRSLPKEFLAMCDNRHPAVVFGSVPSVVTTPALLTRFKVLSHAAVLVWLRDDALKVHSENDVVYLLSAWVQAQEIVSAGQLEELVKLVRLDDCCPAYRQCVIPALDWFKYGHGFLDLFAIVDGMGFEYSLLEFPSLPVAWSAGPRFQRSPSISRGQHSFHVEGAEWHIEAEQFGPKGFIPGWKGGVRDAVYVNGFWMVVALECRESKTNPLELTLGCFAGVDRDKMNRTVPWSVNNAVSFSARVEVGEAVQLFSNFAVTGGKRRGFRVMTPSLKSGQTAMGLKGKVAFSADQQLLFKSELQICRSRCTSGSTKKP
jgi:hypothetical protein